MITTGGKSRRRMAPGQGPGLYRGGKETHKSLAKTTARERKGPK